MARIALLLVGGLILCSTATLAEDPATNPSLGWRPLPREVAMQLAQPDHGAPPLLWPSSLDWRDSGIITTPKDQSICGGCWAFAATGLVEAKAIQAGESASLDLAEQFPISCDVQEFWGIENDGCCGGTATVFEFLSNWSSVNEAVIPYAAGDFDGVNPRSCTSSPPWGTVPCPSPYPTGSGIYVDTWTLLAVGVANEAQLKEALQLGPVWLGYYVYGDFETFWNTGSAGDVYTHTSGALLGGHAVLLIGYDDSKSAWLMKNSWGITGPEGDGTCWISYTANCDFGTDAVKITVTGAASPTAVCCRVDGSCTILSESECAAISGTWIEGEAACSPNPCPEPDPQAACCFGDGGCLVKTEAQCTALSGTWYESEPSCTPNPCPGPAPTAVCCLPNNTCQVITESECDGLSGDWHTIYTNCAGVVCANRRVCCFDTDCAVLFEAECTDLSGDFWPERSTCNPNPCPTETDRPSWGSLKTLFRSSDPDTTDKPE